MVQEILYSFLVYVTSLLVSLEGDIVIYWFNCCLIGPAQKFDGQKTSFVVRLVSALAVCSCRVGSSHTRNCCGELRFSFARCQAEGI